MKKRLFSGLLAVLMLFACSTSALAVSCSTVQTQEASLQSAIAHISNDIPGAEIRVVDGVIHVVVNNLSDVPGFASQASVSSTNAGYTTSNVCAVGGSYRYFQIPWYVEGGSTYIPYSQVYMTKDITSAALAAILDPSFCQWVAKEVFNNVPKDKIITRAKINWDTDLTPGMIDIITDLLIFIVPYFNYQSLKSAQSSSTTGKASAVRCQIEKNEVCFYFPWNNNVCTTYGGYEALWCEGEYDIAR